VSQMSHLSDGQVPSMVSKAMIHVGAFSGLGQTPIPCVMTPSWLQYVDAQIIISAYAANMEW